MISNYDTLFELLLNPLIWISSLGLAFLIRRIWLVFRFSIIWITISLFTFALIGEVTDEQESDIIASLFLIVLISVLIFRPKGFNSNYHQLTDSIGEYLHKQIYSALKEKEEIAGKNIHELIVTGYIFGYINYFLEDAQVKESEHEYIFHTILNGVLPKKLEEMFIRNSARHELAKTTSGLEGEVEKFNVGVKWGQYDAAHGSDENNNGHLKKILIGEKPKIILSQNI